MRLNYAIGDTIAWEMRDGNTMTGTITALPAAWGCRYTVRRVDGTSFPLSHDTITRKASYEDVMASIEFYKNIGKETAQ